MKSALWVLFSTLATMLVWAASALADETVYSCGQADAGGQSNVFNYISVYGINPYKACGVTGLGVNTSTANVVPQGRAGGWVATAPAGLVIAGVSVPTNGMYVDGAAGTGYVAEFYWNGGSSRLGNGLGQFGLGGLSSNGLGFRIRCAATTCSAVSDMQVQDIALQAHETQPPWLAAPDGLWQSTGWVRGDWLVHFHGDSPSGLCALSASLNGQPLPGWSASTRNVTVWHQCSAAPYSQTVHTWDYGQGAVPLSLTAVDAAGVPGAISRTIDIDNTTPSIALSGPQDAPTTAGAQNITATATAGPSGIAGTSCSLDGAPAQWHSGATATIPVQGLGVHAVTCSSANTARDGSGKPGWSAPASWRLSIRQPSISSISFSRLVDALRCTRTRTRVRIPAHWVTVTVSGQRVRVKLPAQTRTLALVRCHPRYTTRRVRIGGHWRTVRVPLLPHTTHASTKHVPYGASTTVSGWLGTDQGVALGHQSVRILTAPDNGQQMFRQVTAATTAADGSWTARLPAGPSRIVDAVYDGSQTVEPSSGQARVTTPASISLDVQPRHTHWGGRIVLSGRLAGGYVPGAGETVILSVHFGGGAHDFAHVSARGDGRFRYVYTFLPGNGTAAYPFSAETVRESDYPYTPSMSSRVTVDVSP